MNLGLYSLENGIDKLKLEFKQDTIKLLNQYMALLIKWNKIYSLTAITNEQQIIIYHLLDGLTVMNHLLPDLHNIIDVGSGMGVPGVIIAICRPDINVWVIDCNSKKTAFLQQAAIELRLKNLHVACTKIEEYQPLVNYDMAISRAFSDASSFLE
nr:16S rRNA (guanine(527)-N(7))-methyltransferase RsmG [Burkholderiales bacterium]